jgi:glutaredoxin
MHQFTEIPYKTFPMVFYEGKFIGGYRDTEKWINKRNAFSGIEFENI